MNKKSIIIIAALAVLTIAAVGVSVWALLFRDTTPDIVPDYAPQQVDGNAEQETDADTSKLEQSSGGGAVSLEYSREVTLSLASREAAVHFKNPSKSTQDMVLQLVIDNKVIASSGRLPAGYKLERLSEVNTEKLTEGGYEGKFNVLYYDTQTGEKAILNTEIPVTITVTQ